MKNNSSTIYNVSLIIGDALAITAAFTVAYILRVSISHKEIVTNVSAIDYITVLLYLLPFWLIIFALLGLYNSKIYSNRFKELGRLIIGTFIGIIFLISYSYMARVNIFPAHLVVVYGYVFALFFVFLFRTIARGIRRQLFDYGMGINNLLIVGDTKASCRIIEALENTAITGYKVIGLVGGKKNKTTRQVNIYDNFDNAKEHLLSHQPHTIIQTELYSISAKNDEILNYAQENHIAYGFVPGNSELFFGNIEADLFYSIPIIAVHQTALIGWGRVLKRTMDIILGGFFLIIATPMMIIIGLIIRLSDGAPAMFRQERLSRFNKRVNVYKFRTHKKKYSGLTTEEAFKKMGRDDLLKKYRDHGDYLKKDPRVTSIGRLIRKFSLDELPQLINVVKGDISLVGPRALVPYELEKYDQKNLITSVRSGLTGLAQISGVRDLSFYERRKLDLYYVENWSIWNDLVILIKTFWVVLRHKGIRA